MATIRATRRFGSRPVSPRCPSSARRSTGCAPASCSLRPRARPAEGLVQTFLPYSDFGDSASALDRTRLGKQRVEVLQLLRALTFPSYGWTSHPATLMWRGYIPALVGYGLSVIAEWRSRGAADSTRALIAEFAPEADGAAQSALAMPSWLGNPALHRSHQSNLIRKLPEFYGPQFPGVPDNLEYVWPGPDPVPPLPAVS